MKEDGSLCVRRQEAEIVHVQQQLLSDFIYTEGEARQEKNLKVKDQTLSFTVNKTPLKVPQQC